MCFKFRSSESRSPSSSRDRGEVTPLTSFSSPLSPLNSPQANPNQPQGSQRHTKNTLQRNAQQSRDSLRGLCDHLRLCLTNEVRRAPLAHSAGEGPGVRVVALLSLSGRGEGEGHTSCAETRPHRSCGHGAMPCLNCARHPAVPRRGRNENMITMPPIEIHRNRECHQPAFAQNLTVPPKFFSAPGERHARTSGFPA